MVIYPGKLCARSRVRERVYSVHPLLCRELYTGEYILHELEWFMARVMCVYEVVVVIIIIIILG